MQYYNERHGDPPTAAVIRWFKHELVQQIWLSLLDKRFMDAYEDGIIVRCGDSIVRRLFPRLIVYSPITLRSERPPPLRGALTGANLLLDV